MLIVTDKLDRGQGKRFTAKFGSFSSSSSSVSIGVNSSDDEAGENEAESRYKGPLDTMDALQEVLPIRRGISKFYNGKSTSFRSLADVESMQVKDVGRPENLFTRRRRNHFNHRMCSRGGISKKPVKTTITMVSSSDDDSYSTSPLPRDHRMMTTLPPLHETQKSNESVGNRTVPVVASPRCFQTPAGRNIHNVIC
ncbi:unnamed protein product [Microthlaspi erraticum]|uniref:Uncharacterized protein n=1 Tax=Microthlaspi erraticum TaxID=1685480 RepID=A0A6D2JXC8_9BRAS|nr:unnamed protein product [Microthlaspi erraticum]CAA7048556.1 unnamed protein product [Microthlaspi erraticum]